MLLDLRVLGSVDECDRFEHDAVIVGVGENTTRRRLVRTPVEMRRALRNGSTPKRGSVRELHDPSRQRGRCRRRREHRRLTLEPT